MASAAGIRQSPREGSPPSHTAVLLPLWKQPLIPSVSLVPDLSTLPDKSPAGTPSAALRPHRIIPVSGKPLQVPLMSDYGPFHCLPAVHSHHCSIEPGYRFPESFFPDSDSALPYPKLYCRPASAPPGIETHSEIVLLTPALCTPPPALLSVFPARDLVRRSPVRNTL